MKKFADDFILFFAEAFYRWGHKSPKYLRVWKSANWLISALTGLPAILISCGVITTPKWTPVVLWIVSGATSYGGAMNSLTVSKPKEVPLPFTDKKQAEEEAKVDQLINAIK